MRYSIIFLIVLCAAQCFAREIIVRYEDSTFFYRTLDDRRIDYDLNLRAFGCSLKTAHKENTALWRRLDANTLVLYADVYDDMTMSMEHYTLRIVCMGMFHVTIDRILHNSIELYGYARDTVALRLLERAAKTKTTENDLQEYQFQEYSPER